jgi:shikimate kinase
MARPIFLIGFMCSGKSRIGRELAQELGWRLVDIDRAVEARVGPLVPYFQDHGEEAFREREREVLLDLLAEQDLVVSTGGGTPMDGDNMDRMLAAGPVVYLDVPLDALMLGLQGEALRSRVEQLLALRLPAYARASHAVDADGNPAEVARRIQQALG